MNILRKAWCRTYQCAFHIAQPLLPYKDPVVKQSINDIPEILRKNNINNVISPALIGQMYCRVQV